MQYKDFMIKIQQIFYMINDCDFQIFKKIPDISNSHNQLSFNPTFVPFDGLFKTDTNTHFNEDKKNFKQFKKDNLKLIKDIQQKQKLLQFLKSNCQIHIQKLHYKDEEIETYAMMVERKKQSIQNLNKNIGRLNLKFKHCSFKCSEIKQKLDLERKHLENASNQKIKEQAQLFELQEKIQAIQASLQINSERFSDIKTKLKTLKKTKDNLKKLKQRKHFLQKEYVQQMQKHQQYTQHKERFQKKIQQLQYYAHNKQIANRKLVVQLKFFLKQKQQYDNINQEDKQISVKRQLNNLKSQESILLNQIKEKDYQIKQYYSSIQLKTKEVSKLKDHLLSMHLKRQQQPTQKQYSNSHQIQILQSRKQDKINQIQMNSQVSGITTQKKQFSSSRNEQISKQKQTKPVFYKQNFSKQQSKVDNMKIASEEMLKIISRYEAIIDRADV